jgi:hypothetical protein
MHLSVSQIQFCQANNSYLVIIEDDFTDNPHEEVRLSGCQYTKKNVSEVKVTPHDPILRKSVTTMLLYQIQLHFMIPYQE